MVISLITVGKVHSQFPSWLLMFYAAAVALFACFIPSAAAWVWALAPAQASARGHDHGDFCEHVVASASNARQLLHHSLTKHCRWSLLVFIFVQRKTTWPNLWQDLPGLGAQTCWETTGSGATTCDMRWSPGQHSATHRTSPPRFSVEKPNFLHLYGRNDSPPFLGRSHRYFLVFPAPHQPQR